MQLIKLPIILKPQPEGGYTITCPVLPELITEADSLEDVQVNVSDALAAVIELYEDLNRPLPAFLRPFTDDAEFLTETVVSVSAA